MKQFKTEHPSYKETRWHLLRIEKNGSLRPFVHFKGLVMFVAGLIFVMAGTIGWLLVAWLDAKGTLVASQETVTRQNREYESIRHEVDGALARLAIAESKLKAVVSGPAMKKQGELLALEEGGETPVETVIGTADTSKAPLAKVPADTIGAPETPPESGDVDRKSVV